MCTHIESLTLESKAMFIECENHDTVNPAMSMAQFSSQMPLPPSPFSPSPSPKLKKVVLSNSKKNCQNWMKVIPVLILFKPDTVKPEHEIWALFVQSVKVSDYNFFAISQFLKNLKLFLLFRVGKEWHMFQDCGNHASIEELIRLCRELSMGARYNPMLSIGLFGPSDHTICFSYA